MLSMRHIILADEVMRILIINSVCGIRSTGRICVDIARKSEENGHEVKIAYGRISETTEESKKWAVKIGGKWSRYIHFLMTRMFDWHGVGLCSYYSTKKFVKWADKYDPDCLWLHNIHGYYINFEILFQWIKSRPGMQVKWTLHDCWAFTGHCAYFDYANCERWKSACYECPAKRDYPASIGLSAANCNWNRKRKAFCGVKNLTLITPSKWLANLVHESFLNGYPVEVVHNAIDISIFKPTVNNWRNRLGLMDKIMILGVASSWDRRKGLADFIELRSRLDERYGIVLVGLTKKQIASMPLGIIGIARTNSEEDLAGMYSAADWLFNPTHEDNYPTVNLEARACGCKIVTYDTGGAAETVEGYDNAWVLSGDNKTPDGFVKLLRAVGNEGMKDE